MEMKEQVECLMDSHFDVEGSSQGKNLKEPR